MTQPHIVFSISNLAARLDLDRRTVTARISRTQVQPFAVTVAGEPFFLEKAVEQLAQAEFEDKAASTEEAAK